jgi:hypothetical protein
VRPQVGEPPSGSASTGARGWSGILFPPATGRATSRPGVAATYASGLVAIGAVALLRQSGLPATSTIWAEDGQIFYAQAMRMSFWHSLLMSHDGYGQLFPRLAVEVARLAQPAQAAEILAIAGAFSLAAIACLVFHMARSHIASPALRALLVAAMVLLPVASGELLDNIVNVPWWLFFASFWALLWSPQTTVGRATAGLVCFLAAASEPLVGLFLPLSVARALALRNARDQGPTAGLVLGLAYQAVVIMRSGGSIGPSTRSLQGVGQSFAIGVGLGVVSGEKATDWLLAHDRQIAVALGALVLCLLLAIGVLYVRSPRVRLFTLVAIGFSVACYIVPVWLRDVAPVLDVSPVQVGGRYRAVPLLLLLSAFFVMADHLAKERSISRGGAPIRRPAHRASNLAASSGRRRHAAAVVVCAAVLCPAWVVDFRDSNQRSASPSWSSQVVKATARCRRAPTTVVLLAIDPPGWSVSLACRDLLR